MPLIDGKLRIFQMAAQLRHFSEAAAALGMTQPNVTQQIAALEKEFGTPLFIRDGRAIRLTPAGKTLQKECEILFGDVAAIRRRVLNSAHENKHYRLGGTMTAGGFLLPLLAADYMEQHPDLTLGITVANTEDIAEMLKTRALDAALIEGPFDREFFASAELCEDELVAAAAPGVLAEPFSLADYLSSGGKFILRESGSGTRYYFDALLRRCGLPPPAPERIIEANNFDAIKKLAAARHGITVISNLAVAEERKNGTLETARFAEGRIDRTLNFIYLAQEDVRFAEDFIAFSRRRMLREKSESSAAPCQAKEVSLSKPPAPQIPNSRRKLPPAEPN